MRREAWPASRSRGSRRARRRAGPAAPARSPQCAWPRWSTESRTAPDARGGARAARGRWAAGPRSRAGAGRPPRGAPAQSLEQLFVQADPGVSRLSASLRAGTVYHRQQPHRHPAAVASRPARAQPHRPVQAPQLPRPRQPPARKNHAAARRTAQLARREPALDRADIRLYRDHCASKRERTAPIPARSRQRTGGAIAYNDVITVPPRHQRAKRRHHRGRVGHHAVPDRSPGAQPKCPRTHQYSHIVRGGSCWCSS